MTKEEEIMDFLARNVFDPILNSSEASDTLKKESGTQLCDLII